MVKKWEDFNKTKFLTDSHDLLAVSNTESSKWKEYVANSSALILNGCTWKTCCLPPT